MSRPALLIALLAIALPAFAQPVPAPAPLRTREENLATQVAMAPELGTALPLDVVLRDEGGREVALGGYFGGKRPVVLMLVYYRCPMLCQLAWSGLLRTLRPLSLDPGRDFEVVALSIDPRETPELAAAKKASLLAEYQRPTAPQGFHLLTGEASAIERVAASCGFRYAYDPMTGEYAHGAGLFLCTPDGRISRVLYGTEIAPRDLQLGLVEASEGRLGTPITATLLLCFRYDPTRGRYTMAVMRLLQLSALATMAVLGAAIYVMSRRRRRALVAAAPGAAP